jgi:hypothetical protein
MVFSGPYNFLRDVYLVPATGKYYREGITGKALAAYVLCFPIFGRDLSELGSGSKRKVAQNCEEKRCERVEASVQYDLSQIYFFGLLFSQIGIPSDSVEFFPQPERCLEL